MSSCHGVICHHVMVFVMMSMGFNNISHLLAVALALGEEVAHDALGEEGAHVRGPRLPHHLEVDLHVPLERDLVN